MESFTFPLWEPSGGEASLFVGVDEANLRGAPAADAAVITPLPLGAAVRVLERGKDRQKVGEYVNHWYRVEYMDTKGTPGAGDDAPVSGWLFGNILTPIRIEADLDGDGEQEVATAVMSADFKVRVRVLEPNLKPPHRVSSVDLSPGFLGVAANLVPAKTAGLPLVKVESVAETCANAITAYVSYTVPGNKKGVLGNAKLALELNVMEGTGTSYELSFQPKQKGLTVVWTNTGEDESEQTKAKSRREWYRLEDGVFSKVKPAGSAVAETTP
ncbi:SH3 domain-containing protein [Myxococcus sp. RHSTA-1-4]|uniref:SH3 domain-containing protein n=1 Tax=Myxococcus sp. RHSTA-1-4 TaxID=2874601 RepID=UPI001CBFCA74|nr:SH3 domain-containing protein [Myxococcus sp. RHSTA-1-4]